MTVPTPGSERAATPEARRITSAGHSSRGAPRPTTSTLATATTLVLSPEFTGMGSLVSCSKPPLAPRARRATSISPIASASRNDPPTTVGDPSLSGSETTGTISTAADERFPSVVATVTVGAW